MTNKFFLFSALIVAVLFSSCAKDDDNTTTCDGGNSVFTINLDPSECTTDIQAQLGISSSYVESVSGTTRSITINGIPNHLIGTFPNDNNPNSPQVSSESYTMTTTPTLAASTTSTAGRKAGVLFSGVSVDVYTGEFFRNGNQNNMAWNYTVLQSANPLGIDCNNGHVNPNGRYHYHGIPTNYGEDLGALDGSQMVKIGYAGDGFPIYYKYGYDDSGNSIVAYESGYTIIEGERGGDGTTAPDGCYDGTYFQDYEFTGGTGLDECNGRTGKTPDSNNEYYYISTENFPSMPMCLSGTPDASFGN